MCKVGDKVYEVYDLFNEKIIQELIVYEIMYDKKGIKKLCAETEDGHSRSEFSRGLDLDTICFSKEEADNIVEEHKKELSRRRR